MTEILKSVIAAIGIDIGKNSFHVVGLDGRGAVALRQKWSRGQVEARLANMAACLIGMEACLGALRRWRPTTSYGSPNRGSILFAGAAAARLQCIRNPRADRMYKR